MPNYSVRWHIDIEDADSPLEAAHTALEMLRDPTSGATVFEVQIWGLDATEKWDAIYLTPKDEPLESNSWQLHDQTSGRQDCGRRLDFAMVKALAEMDAAIRVGETVKIAALEAHTRVNQIMLNPINLTFGANATKPQQRLVDTIRAHIKEIYPDSVGDF